MSKFLVVGTITISVHTEVEAENAKQAEGLALARPVMSLCNQCAGGDERDVEWVTAGELDGEVELIEVDPLE